jgi:tRNA nucleotidyltransferase (CCA-adding enzyme)
MEVILTHEQADFDALASLYCAHLLNEHSVPVLPNRLNRNVRNFLNLYGADFPFKEARDLASTAIQHVILVDTQSLVTLKGITAKTTVSVIDHHETRSDLPGDWQVRFERVGATVTIMVEQLRELNRHLNQIQATLLLLGIYEDTGSLSYASTTVRDVKAAAFLLEHGASLRVAVDFLNPALSSAQKKLADQLLANASTVPIHGKSILIASAEAPDMSEEISSIAHKIRDLLDPDALFLFVRTSEGIRLVARSTSDQVDVATIARLLGGGGHERAAAALIQPETIQQNQVTLDSLQQQVVEELKSVIKPPLTVSKIMSRRPHLITPATSLEDAHQLMQRYGYEGYPVVENDKVVGLLTRRAVDRARQHKLKLTAGSLMEAGEHCLKSNDTIDQLQQLMAATGWGQIPVVDPDTGRIVGIVTRTDLLKTLPGHNGTLPGQKNYAAMLEKALPACRLALIKMIARYSGEENQSIYIVGGFVRDLLLERPSLDFDIVVEGDAVRFAHALAKKYGGRVVSHRRFNTAKWQISGIHNNLKENLGCSNTPDTNLPDALDFISARTEFYDHPTALPTVERSSIKLDLHRRDFTINTLALRLDGHHYGELYDYWGGLADLEKRLVRVLHSLSFVDDPTRLLRAVRFEQRFQFQIEKRTLQLMGEARELLRQLSGERLHHEFDLIFNESSPFPILRRLTELDLLSQIHPHLVWEEKHESAITNAFNYTQLTAWQLPENVGNTPIHLALTYLIWFSQLWGPSGREIAGRFRVSKSLLDTLEKTISLSRSVEEWATLPPSQLTLTLEKLPIYGVFALYCMIEDNSLKEKLNLYATRWRFITPGVDGNTLRSRGVPPGPFYARILAQVRNAWLDGEITSASEEDLMVTALLKDHDDGKNE